MKRILIAEDDLISRRLLQKTLEEWGYEVTQVKDGQEAWAFLQKVDIRLVIADWIMPGINGITSCRSIRESKMP
ncbi:MAG: response regulator, partial [Nitrospirae bacterium]|nr:response regulator [Nitrospirota bacterium]